MPLKTFPLSDVLAAWRDGDRHDAMYMWRRLSRPDAEAFAAAVLTTPADIVDAIYEASSCVTPSEAAANENYEANHRDDGRWD